ncbi:reverse transcriptase domain-containing protein [Tanacetum coccineum]
MMNCDVKGVTTRGGKTMTQDAHDNDTSVLPKEPVVVEPEKLVRSNEVLANDQPQSTSEPVVQPSNEVQTPPVPFPRRLRKEKEEAQQKKFLENLKQLYINLPFIKALAQMPKYAKFLKGLLTNKARLEEACKIIMNERCSAVLLNKLPSKEKDLRIFTIPCDIGQLHIDNALADLGASIILMPYTMYKKLGLGEPKATRMSLELADRFCHPESTKDSRVPIILGRPFLATARAMIDVFNKKITLRVGDDEVVFDVDQSIKRPTTEDDECYGIDDLDDAINEEAQELLANEKHDSSWVSPIHVVPKKGGMTVVLNDNNELIPSRTVTGWRVCIDYRKLNDATRKDHFPLPFIDQMLERLCGNEYYCFLDGFLGFFQIPIALEDQEKTTFTYPYGTFAYQRMPFGLCNDPATFQRCMTAIFHDMVEDFMEVFMDDFSVFEGIVLGHKISRAGIEVDRAKIDVIAKLPYPTNVKGVRSFLGHVGFYRRFIKDFSMISKPMTQLLMKNAKFDFSDDCKKAFNILKEKLTTAPIIISPDWNAPFELMCDTSDFAVGAVLGRRIDGKFKPIYYASKTLNNAQEHYTTTKKELLTLFFSS